ncbi:MAG: hypothetical protein KatS3mg102_2519 [Planctomycetota bacterium]|nr:MAG: hypothetical protein KatS3mg102_2519 [Planctomycetota bacterium]
MVLERAGLDQAGERLRTGGPAVRMAQRRGSERSQRRVQQLILFDIDGTLLDSRGAGRRALARALCEVVGTAHALAELPLAGRTDPEICRAVLETAGLPPERVAQALPRIFECYPRHLARELQGCPPRVLPGVQALLEALEHTAGAVVGLLTGNVTAGARLKLGAAGLAHRFRFGAYGEEAPDRQGLLEVALGRAARTLGRQPAPSQVVVLGDTPRDVACARAGGARAVAVATGPYDLVALRACEPDHLFADLRETARVLAALCNGSAAAGQPGAGAEP